MLGDVWEATSFRLEREEGAQKIVKQKERGLAAGEDRPSCQPSTAVKSHSVLVQVM